MSINKEVISIANLEIDVVRKDIKNMHLAVYPPMGRIRLAAPNKTDNEVLRLFAISKLGWIKKHVKNFSEQPRESPREYVTGESHYVDGKRYLLKVTPTTGWPKIEKNGKKLTLMVKSDSTKEYKSNTLKEWRRKELKKIVPELIGKWENKIGVKCNSWGVKSMKTMWGTCNPDGKRITLNLELSKKPIICLEYIIAHELIHLLERNHNDQFIAHMDKYMPKWRLHRIKLNELPVAHNEWGY